MIIVGYDMRGMKMMEDMIPQERGVEGGIIHGY
jgi:hypothetical protein